MQTHACRDETLYDKRYKIINSKQKVKLFAALEQIIALSGKVQWPIAIKCSSLIRRSSSGSNKTNELLRATECILSK